MIGTASRWAPWGALIRRSRRLATRSPLRTASTGVLVVLAVAAGVTVLATVWGHRSSTASVDRAFGRADFVYGGGASPVTEVPRAVDALRSVLPAGSEVVVEQVASGLTFHGPDGDRSGDVAMADWRAPLLDGVLGIVAGRAPRAGEVVVTPLLAEAVGVDVGDPLRVVGSVRPLRVVGIATIGNSGTYSVAAVPGAVVPSPSSPESLDVQLRAFVDLPDRTTAPAATAVPGDGGVPGFQFSGPSGRTPSKRMGPDAFVAVATTYAPLGPTVGVLVSVLLVVGLLAGAVFGIGAGRRMRANGLLAANGADDGQLAVGAASEAVVVVLPAALAGVVSAWVLRLVWIRFRLPRWSSFVDASLPWMWTLVVVVAAVVAASIGAVLFSRSGRRQPTAALLDARVPRTPTAVQRQRLSGLAWLGIGMFGWVVLYAFGVSAVRWLGIVAAVGVLGLWLVCAFGAMRLVRVLLDRDAVGRLVRRELERRRIASTAVVVVVATWVFVAVAGAATDGFALAPGEVNDSFTSASGEATTSVTAAPVTPTTTPPDGDVPGAGPTATIGPAASGDPGAPTVGPPGGPGTAVLVQPLGTADPATTGQPAAPWIVRGSAPSPTPSPLGRRSDPSVAAMSQRLAAVGLATSRVTVGNWTGSCSVCPKGFTPTVMVLDHTDGLGLAPSTVEILRSGSVVTPFDVAGVDKEQVGGRTVRVGSLPSGVNAALLGSAAGDGMGLAEQRTALIGDAAGLDAAQIDDLVRIVHRAGWGLSGSEARVSRAWDDVTMGHSTSAGSTVGVEWNAWPWLGLLVAVSLAVTATHRREHGDAARVLQLLGAGPRAGRRLASLTAAALTGVGVAIGLTASLVVVVASSGSFDQPAATWNRQASLLVVVSIAVPVVVGALARLIPPYRSLDGPDGPMPA